MRSYVPAVLAASSLLTPWLLTSQVWAHTPPKASPRGKTTLSTRLHTTKVEVQLPKTYIVLQPGQTYEARGALLNYDATPVTAVLFGAQIVNTSSGGLGFAPVRGGLTLSTHTMTVPAGRTASFTFAVHVPYWKKPGAYVLGVVAQYSPGKAVIHRGLSTFEIGMNIRSVALLAVWVEGKNPRATQFTTALAAHGMVERRMTPYSYTVTTNVSNSGNAYEYVTSTLILTNGKRRTRFPGPIVLLQADSTSPVVFTVPYLDIGKHTVAYLVFQSQGKVRSLSGPLRVLPYAPPPQAKHQP